MSDSVDTAFEIQEGSAVPPLDIIDPEDVEPITGWDETTIPEEGEPSTESLASGRPTEPAGAPIESAEAEVAGFADTSFLSAQISNKPPASAMSKYERTKLPDANKAATLPGAFFFLTITYKDKKLNQVVAYDPYVVAGNKAKDILAYYETHGLPYYEYFDESATGKWEYGTDYYSGSFGGKENPNKGIQSPPWPYADKASAITNGVNISFWNTKTENGLFTSAPNTPFTKQKALSPIVRLNPASGKNFIQTTS